MFSKLDPIFQTIVRKIEQTDPRMDIKREGHGNEGDKGKDESETTPSALLWEDHTDVSIVALIAFIENLVQSAVTVPPSSSPPSPSAEFPISRTEITTPSASVQHARAISAYRHAGHALRSPFSSVSPPSMEAPELSTDFSDDDVAQLRSCLSDLILLQNKGVKSISLRRSTTFLASISESIASTLAGM